MNSPNKALNSSFSQSGLQMYSSNNRIVPGCIRDLIKFKIVFVAENVSQSIFEKESMVGSSSLLLPSISSRKGVIVCSNRPLVRAFKCVCVFKRNGEVSLLCCSSLHCLLSLLSALVFALRVAAQVSMRILVSSLLLARAHSCFVAQAAMGINSRHTVYSP